MKRDITLIIENQMHMVFVGWTFSNLFDKGMISLKQVISGIMLIITQKIVPHNSKLPFRVWCQ